MTRFTKIATLALVATALATGIAAAQPYGGGRGPGMGMGGPGMGMGMGPRADCPFAGEQAAVDRALTVEKVKSILEGRLAWHSNDRLKVGKVADKDDKTITAEIVTVDGSLVQTLTIDKATGQGLHGRGGFGPGRGAGLGYRWQTPQAPQPKVQ
ncbi:MAG: hypothetical protein FJ311_01725 [Rhodospirillales bacterium]|nr:hypothetical protein [Rhodospirillales bacterium]